MATPCPAPQVLTMFEKADAEYAELSQKKQILHMDKDKIQKVIGELDEKKREALHASWVKVNQDFGSVFSSLLPGTMAKLEPPEGQTFLAGLEVKVLTASLLSPPACPCSLPPCCLLHVPLLDPCLAPAVQL